MIKNDLIYKNKFNKMLGAFVGGVMTVAGIATAMNHINESEK